jgi:hypothetical protein
LSNDETVSHGEDIAPKPRRAILAATNRPFGRFRPWRNRRKGRTIMRFLIHGLTALAVVTAAAGNLAPASAQAATENPIARQSIEQLRLGIEAKHPATYYALAKRLFERGDRDESVFWFYVGQLRYRSYLASYPNLKPDGDPALFGALSETIGRPINAYAFGDMPALTATIDRVLAWDAAHGDTFSSKGPARDKVREGLIAMKAHVVANQDQLRATRAANGLENRSR